MASRRRSAATVLATAIGDALWNGEELDQGARESIVGLYRLLLRHDAMLLEKVKGSDMFLLLAMTPERILRMKPQNLITGLPLVQIEAASCSAHWAAFLPAASSSGAK